MSADSAKAPGIRREYVIHANRLLTLDEAAFAARVGLTHGVECVTVHYTEGPVRRVAVARGIRTMDEMRALCERRSPA
jgi:hypothetical protein